MVNSRGDRKHNHRKNASKRQRLLGLLSLFLSGLLLFTGVDLGLSPRIWAATEPSPTAAWVAQGLERYHAADYAQAISFWQQALNHPSLPPATAFTLHRYLARADQASGDIYAAIAQFDWLIDAYRRQPNPRELGRMLTEQAQNYSRLGHHPRAASLLCRQIPTLEIEDGLDSDIPLERQPLACNPESAAAIALDTEDAVGLAAALGSLGQIQQMQGESDLAIATLKQGLQQLATLNTQSPEFSAYCNAIWNSLGNLYDARAARQLRLAEFAQTKRETATMERFFARAKADNQLALQAFRESIDRLPPRVAGEKAASEAKTQSRSASRSASAYPSDLESPTEFQSTPDQILRSVQGRINAISLTRRSWPDGVFLESQAKEIQANAVADSVANSQADSQAMVREDLQAWEKALRELRSLPASHAHIYALIKLAALSQPLAPLQSPLRASIRLDPQALAAVGLNLSAFRLGAPTYCAPLGPRTLPLLQEAQQMAQRLQDHQAESFVLGQIGHLYECQANFPEALALTRQARLLAPGKDSRYRWDWQEARILRAQGDDQAALAAYEELLRTLQGIRGELAIATRDFQLDFRETIGAIYRELLQLRIQALPQLRPDPPTAQAINLEQSDALERILQDLDELHLFELQNYLGTGCELPPPKPLTAQDRSTAFISTLVLADRLAVILTLPTD
ncbi:MAG: hypothetical protein HC771_23165, partial [Synechococcales cyanobacterium CRU_2_2]|nr:hypothetical protein [Synechococcales cyanobacterium CRU_2_2]